MKARKILAALGAALMMIGVSAPASAFDCGTAGNPYDKDVIAEGLEALAMKLRCDGPYSSDANPGTWPNANPIWERRRMPDCKVHSNLARKLLEDRELDDESTKPPRNKHHTNRKAGASWDVMFEKYDGALSKLDSFLNDAKKARLNSIFVPGGTKNATVARDWFTSEVKAARDCVYHFVL